MFETMPKNLTVADDNSTPLQLLLSRIFCTRKISLLEQEALLSLSLSNIEITPEDYQKISLVIKNLQDGFIQVV
jgi:hypothetical protein